MKQRLALIVVLVAAPSLAAAQSIVTTESNDQDRIINVSECSGAVQDLLSFSWTTTTTSITGTYDLLASDQAGCPTPQANTTTTAHTITIQSSIAQTAIANVISVPNLLSQLSIACPGPATTVNLCLFPSGTSTGGIYGGTTTAATGAIQLDLQTPPAPVINSVSAGDSSLNVSWQQGSGSADAGMAGAAASYNVYCDVHPAASPITRKCKTVTGAGTTSTKITGLQNGTEYDVEVTALSIGSNESPHSASGSGVPIQIDDFWRLYKADGGREQGGCATGAAGLVALIALLPLAFRRRRTRP